MVLNSLLIINLIVKLMKLLDFDQITRAKVFFFQNGSFACNHCTISKIHLVRFIISIN